MNIFMSEYAEITIGKLLVCCFRNYLDSEIVSLFFSKNDLIVIQACRRDDDKDASTYIKYVYKKIVQCAKERLDARAFVRNQLIWRPTLL